MTTNTISKKIMKNYLNYKNKKISYTTFMQRGKAIAKLIDSLHEKDKKRNIKKSI